MNWPRSAIQHYFGQDSLNWFRASYLLDWVGVGLLWLLWYMISFWPVFERDFSPQDALISHPHKHNQTGSALNFGIALYIPIILLVVIGLRKKSLIGIHHGSISLLAGCGLARLITQYLKHKVGRLRPDFLARCKWEEVAKHCSGKKSTILDGRQSFPSGHSSTAFAGMAFLTLWLAGHTAAFCPAVPLPPKLLSSRIAAFILTLSPLLWAVHVAVTRIEDYRHHKEDVIVGGLIGIFSTTTCYLLFWPSPFHASSFTASNTTEPRELYTPNPRQATQVYELAAMEDDVLNTV